MATSTLAPPETSTRPQTLDAAIASLRTIALAAPRVNKVYIGRHHTAPPGAQVHTSPSGKQYYIPSQSGPKSGQATTPPRQTPPTTTQTTTQTATTAPPTSQTTPPTPQTPPPTPPATTGTGTDSRLQRLVQDHAVILSQRQDITASITTATTSPNWYADPATARHVADLLDRKAPLDRRAERLSREIKALTPTTPQTPFEPAAAATTRDRLLGSTPLRQTRDMATRSRYKATVMTDVGRRLQDKLTLSQSELQDAATVLGADSYGFGSSVYEKLAGTITDYWAWTARGGRWLAGAAALQQVVADKFGLPSAAMTYVRRGYPADQGTTRAMLDHPAARTVLRAYADAVYESTQEDLAKRGITHVTAVRGMGWTTSDAPDWTAKALGPTTRTKRTWGGEARVPLNPINSFSTDYSWGHNYATQHAIGGVGGVVGMTVPADKVFSTFNTGPGSLNEQEITIVGGPDTTARVYLSSSSGAIPASIDDYGKQTETEKLDNAEPLPFMPVLQSAILKGRRHATAQHRHRQGASR